jgi:hypothetical protein
MLDECRKSFKPPTVILAALVLEEEMLGAILHGQTQLAFPGATRIQIRRVCSKRAIGMSSRKFWHLEVELDSFKGVQKFFGILDRIQFEEFNSCEEAAGVEGRTAGIGGTTTGGAGAAGATAGTAGATTGT